MNLITSYQAGALLLLVLYSHPAISQADTIATALSLEECIEYGLENQPILRQSQLDEGITQKEISANLAAWLPQVGINLDFTDNLDKPNIVLPNQETGGSQVIEVGVEYQSNATLEATQTLFNNDVRVAARTASSLRLQAQQNTLANRIDVFVEVSQAFFSLITARDQIEILDEDIERLEKSVRDARLRYENGIADNVDYKQATIQLNNALAQRATIQEQIPYRKAILKQRMGYPQDQVLEIAYDIEELQSEILSDTIPSLVLKDRVEYRLLHTQRELQDATVSRYRWGFLPSLDAFYNYQYSYFNDNFDQLYDRSFTSSQVGLRMSIPLLQGTARIRNLQAAKLQSEWLSYEQKSLADQLTTEYEESRAAYRGAYRNWQLQRENEQLAQEVYGTIQLQYDEGIIPYIEVIQAETDLRSAQLNTSNALLQVLANKVSLLRALGTVPVN